MKRIAVLLAVAAGLSGCASMPTEYKSPCACNYEPINVGITGQGLV